VTDNLVWIKLQKKPRKHKNLKTSSLIILQKESILRGEFCSSRWLERFLSRSTMTSEKLKELLRRFKSGGVTERAVLQRLSELDPETLGFATVDHHRQLRQGFPEVIFCEGKTPRQVAAIGATIARRKQPLLATRASIAHFRAVKKLIGSARYNAIARTISANPPRTNQNGGFILVVTAGTSDIPVAEEAVVTAAMFGNRVQKIYDVGVAGLHRLLAHNELLRSARVIIVVAGMEGALPSVVAGIVDVPLIAVPTSVGYGTSFGGITALLAMLNSCASGVTVVNIDNGFGAAFAASLIMRNSSH
jgi:NCAIR mutase (PurE)-related protein